MAKKAPAAAIFVFAALFHLAASASRFPDLGALLPLGVAEAIVPLFFALLMCQGLLVARHRGEVRELSRVAKASFALAFVYLAVLVLQTWDISIGPLDPTPPAEWPLATRARWFATFTVGMIFPFYLAARAILIPASRVLMRPFARLPLPAGLAISVVVGLGLGAGALQLFASAGVGGTMGDVSALLKRPEVTLATILGGTALTIVLAARSKS